MKTLLRSIAATALVAGMAFSLHAQEKSIGMLTVGKGTVMTSTGGEFNPATTGQMVNVGDRIMIGEGGMASVAYPGCTTVRFTEPGVYTINEPAACRENNDEDSNTADESGAAGESSVVATNVGFITFEALIAAAGVASSALDDDEDLVDGAQPPQPVSP
jgi:hypothetical protein